MCSVQQCTPVVMIRPIWEHRHTLPHEVANYQPVSPGFVVPWPAPECQSQYMESEPSVANFRKLGGKASLTENLYILKKKLKLHPHNGFLAFKSLAK